MDLPHPERHRWVKVISEINQRINATQAGAPAEAAPAPRTPPPLPPPKPGADRLSPGVALRSDPSALQKVLAERAAREAKASSES